MKQPVVCLSYWDVYTQKPVKAADICTGLLNIKSTNQCLWFTNYCCWELSIYWNTSLVYLWLFPSCLRLTPLYISDCSHLVRDLALKFVWVIPCCETYHWFMSDCSHALRFITHLSLVVHMLGELLLFHFWLPRCQRLITCLSLVVYILRELSLFYFWLPTWSATHHWFTSDCLHVGRIITFCYRWLSSWSKIYHWFISALPQTALIYLTIYMSQSYHTQLFLAVQLITGFSLAVQCWKTYYWFLSGCPVLEDLLLVSHWLSSVGRLITGFPLAVQCWKTYYWFLTGCPVLRVLLYTKEVVNLDVEVDCFTNRW